VSDLRGARDRFDDATFRALIARLRERHRIVRFRDFAGGAEPEAPWVLLRHDVDYDPAAALRLARLESDLGVSASYFVLFGAPCYDPLASENAGFAAELVRLGHEVGLHYDLRVLAAVPEERRERLLESQAELLAALSGEPVLSIAGHQPGLFGTDPKAGARRFVDAYAPRFFREIPYVSDSGRAFRDAGWRVLSGGEPLPQRFQLVLHPIDWTAEGNTMEELFGGVHERAADALRREGAELLRLLGEHSGVREHRAAIARGDL
jgi:hypothetical protein